MVKPGINEEEQLVPCQDMFKMYIGGEKGQVVHSAATEELFDGVDTGLVV